MFDIFPHWHAVIVTLLSDFFEGRDVAAKREGTEIDFRTDLQPRLHWVLCAKLLYII